MKRILITICLIAIAASYSHAQTDWKAELQKELVTIEDGQYKNKEYQLLKFENGASFQIAISSSAQMDVMTRDNFIAIYSTLGIFTIVSILTEAGLTINDVNFEDLDEPDGTPEIELDFKMTQAGLEMTVITEDGKEVENMTWEEFFADN